MLLLPLFISIASLLMPAKAELLFAGDAMQHQSQLDAARQDDGSYDYAPYFSAIKSYIISADYAVVNLETPLGGKPYSGYPMFCAPDSYAKALSDAGFDLLLTANNHMLDRRDKGLKRTVTVLDSLGIPHIGVYRNSSDRANRSPFIADINGFRVAFLNYTYGTNGIAIQGDAIVDYINIEKIQKDVTAARNAGAEIVTVCIHWGDEYLLLPPKRVKSMANSIADMGVDMIIGGHPHVIQPMEMRTNPHTGKKQFIAYSLGNFISGMKTTDTRGGATARITLTRDSAGNAAVSEAKYKLFFVVPPHHNGSNYNLTEAGCKQSGIIETWRKNFVFNAQRIFGKYNLNVPEDTVRITK